MTPQHVLEEREINRLSHLRPRSPQDQANALEALDFLCKDAMAARDSNTPALAPPQNKP